MKLHYNHTRYACYLGYITQAIVNNLAPLLFVTFQDQFSVSLEKIGLLISFNFGIQMIVDILAAKFVDKIGYRICTVAAHICCTAGLIGMGVFPFLFADPFIGLLTAVFINALGGGMIEVVISPIVESLPGDEKASAMSLLHSFYCWGHVGVVILSTLFFCYCRRLQLVYSDICMGTASFVQHFLFCESPPEHLTYGRGSNASAEAVFHETVLDLPASDDLFRRFRAGHVTVGIPVRRKRPGRFKAAG